LGLAKRHPIFWGKSGQCMHVYSFLSHNFDRVWKINNVINLLNTRTQCDFPNDLITSCSHIDVWKISNIPVMLDLIFPYFPYFHTTAKRWAVKKSAKCRKWNDRHFFHVDKLTPPNAVPFFWTENIDVRTFTLFSLTFWSVFSRSIEPETRKSCSKTWPVV
jgi:hypothetical protein